MPQSTTNSCRNLGCNYALALKTGGGTHMTLVYLDRVKRGYEQDRVKRLVEDFLRDTNIPEILPLTCGDFTSKRCISVVGNECRVLQTAVYEYLLSQKFDVRPLRPLHIDLRGQSDAVLDNRLLVYDNWNW